jgi:hypothetical protein
MIHRLVDVAGPGAAGRGYAAGRARPLGERSACGIAVEDRDRVGDSGGDVHALAARADGDPVGIAGRASMGLVAEPTQTVEQRLEEIRIQLAWVRDYL